MKQFLVTLPRNLIGCFKGRWIVWHVIAIVLTFVLVTSGFDWRYFLATRSPALRSWAFPAVVIGGLLPLALPLILFTHGVIARNARATLIGWAVVQAALLGLLISSAYKATTGRAHPSHGVGADIQSWLPLRPAAGRSSLGQAVVAHHRRLCDGRDGIHAPPEATVSLGAILCALYVGVRVSMTIHWFSDFEAGAILGSVIGAAAGKSSSAACPLPGIL